MSHEWINDRLDLERASHKLWILLGEARSKCAHISGVPLAPALAERLSHVYVAKGVHATTAIEGNTLTEEQVRQQIHQKLDLPRSQACLNQELINIIAS
jgi:Fic family protein